MAPIKKRAQILALAQVFWAQIAKEKDYSPDLLHWVKPLDYSRVELMGTYELLEKIRNHAKAQAAAAKKAMRGYGGHLPQYAIDLTDSPFRSAEVWMCTVGAGIVPSVGDDVAKIWSYLMGAFAQLEEAIQEIRQFEELTTRLTGRYDQEVFSLIDTDDWIAMCAMIVPDSFVQKLKLTNEQRSNWLNVVSKGLQDEIAEWADVAESNDGRERADAEYVAICGALDEYKEHPEWERILVDIVAEQYPQHLEAVLQKRDKGR